MFSVYPLFTGVVPLLDTFPMFTGPVEVSLLPSEPGITFPVPGGDVTFIPFPGTVLFSPQNLDVKFEVRHMDCVAFEVPAGQVTFRVLNYLGKKFTVPPGALGKVFKPK